MFTLNLWQVLPWVCPETPPADVSLRGRKLRIITKIATIELTPENPKYRGGTWHVEGLLKNVVAREQGQ